MIVRPCPFCKSYDIKYSNKTTDRGNKRHIAIFCNNCHCYGPRTIISVDKNKYYTAEEKKQCLLK